MTFAGLQAPRAAGYQASSRRLEGRDREDFDALVATRGVQPASVMLGCSVATIHRLSNGGFAQRQSVARVSARLEELRR